MSTNNSIAIAPAPFAPADILTPKELAERLKVKPGWIYEQMRPWRKNPLPVMRAGRLLRFSWVAVCEWLRGTKSEQQPVRKRNTRIRKAVAR